MSLGDLLMVSCGIGDGRKMGEIYLLAWHFLCHGEWSDMGCLLEEVELILFW